MGITNRCRHCFPPRHRVRVQGFVNKMDEYMRTLGDLHTRMNYKSYIFLPGIRGLYISALSLSHTKSWYPRFFVSIFQTYSLRRPVPEPSRRPPSVACLASSPASCLGRRRETSPMSWTTAWVLPGQPGGHCRHRRGVVCVHEGQGSMLERVAGGTKLLNCFIFKQDGSYWRS